MGEWRKHRKDISLLGAFLDGLSFLYHKKYEIYLKFKGLWQIL